MQPLLQWKSNNYYIMQVCVWNVAAQGACAILSSVTCTVIQYFSALSHKRLYF